VIGYWKVPNYKKHDYNYYYDRIKTNFKNLIHNNVIFYYKDDDILNIVKRIKNTNIIFIKKYIKELPTWEISSFYLESCKNQNNIELRDLYDSREYEKGLVHYKREFLLGGPEVYRKIFTIWTSKIYLIENAITENPFNTEYFSWIDAGLRNNINEHIQSINYKNNHINGLGGSCMNYLGEKVHMCAGVIISDKNTWLNFIPLYKEELENNKNSNYAHDEETLLHILYKKYPNLVKSNML